MSTTKPAFKAASLTVAQLLQRSAWFPLLDEAARERVLDEIREVEVAAGA
ncbi:MAG TPA: Crp/Fnr family transcriptional regulator, partial [Variovorax sp.]|nr:Crp/Fnr family transcriptional regulator [Variovorax sp.]